MPVLSSADLKRLPNLVSLLRIPLAVVFPWVADRPVVALAVICLAGGTDVLDGWLARKGGQATAVGAVIDPIADKVFAIVVVGTLVVHGRMPLWAIAAMLVREILEAPLLVWVLVSAKKRRARRMQARANIPGKAATVVQFGAVASALLWPSILEAMLVLAALCGMVAGVSYWRRELMGTAEGQSV